jgi:hypothetical protein
MLAAPPSRVNHHPPQLLRPTGKPGSTVEFLNNTAFHIFGHGGCFGDIGHCDITGVPRPYDPRPAHPLTPATKVVIATDAINLAMQRKKKSVTITIVPLILSGTPRCNYENFMKFDRVALVAYR